MEILKHCRYFNKLHIRHKIIKTAVLLLVSLCLILDPVIMVHAAETVSSDDSSVHQLVHVGYFNFAGYHNMDISGEKSGYGYDFLQMIAGYANFSYIYVGYQKSWNDMLDMLENGEIDMLTYGIKSPEYEKRFDFSAHSIGTSSALLTTSVANSAFAANNYMPFNGMRVGMLREGNRKSAFDEYAAREGFDYKVVYYDDVSTMESDLQDGKKIDAMVADELRILSNEIIIDKFDSRELYVMVKKGNTALLDTIDNSIKELNAADPGWTVELQNRYFSAGSSSVTSETLSESKYISSLISGGTKLKVLFNPAGYPFTYYQDGQPTGILVDLFRKIADSCKLPYEYIKVESVSDYYRIRKDSEADIIIDFTEGADAAEVLGYRLTSSYADSDYSIVTPVDSSGNIRTIALIKDSEMFTEMAKAYNPRARIIYYDTFDECIKAVRSGKADCAYTYSLTAQLFMIRDNKNRLKATQLNDSGLLFHLAVNSDTDMIIYGLLNKAVHNTGASETNELYNSYLLDAKRSYSLGDFLSDNPFIIITLIAAVLLTLICFILVQRSNNRALNRSRDALEKALDEANTASLAKTKFLSQMSHDIRTPLNGIIGMTHIAQNRLTDTEIVSDALDKIDRSSDILLTLVNDILDLSRIESGKVTMAHQPADISATVNQCADILKNPQLDKNIHIFTDIEPFSNPNVLTDALHVRQILINVISNAVKFTPDGGSITFSEKNTVSFDGSRLDCIFAVADTGIGMSADFLKKIYDPFVQADFQNARTQYKGSGLGMSIVKQYVDMLGGTIDIHSVQSSGTTVTICLSFDIDPDAAAHLQNSGNLSFDSASLKGLHILLADDNDINLEIACITLENNGMIVDTARNGKEAIGKFEASAPGEYSCILMDIMMPEMNGYEATAAIRRSDRPDAAAVPIIAMTANAFAEDIKLALSNGMTAHVAKPFNRDILFATMAECIAGAKSQEIRNDG